MNLVHEGPHFERDGDSLEPVGAGTQGQVFGTERWVVKVRRFSLLSVLARWISSWRWVGEAGEALGGLAAPFLRLENVTFRAPKVPRRPGDGNRQAMVRYLGRPTPIVDYREKVAIARRRYESDDFLDHRLSLAEPAQALALVEEMVVLVERVRARGFYMHDFVMSNFVVVDGRLMIADIGLITPVRAMWEPAMRICAWGFARGLSKDYQRLLGELLYELGDGDPQLREEIVTFSESLPARIGRLRKREVPGLAPEHPEPVRFDPALEKEIRAALGSVR